MLTHLLTGTQATNYTCVRNRAAGDFTYAGTAPGGAGNATCVGSIPGGVTFGVGRVVLGLLVLSELLGCTMWHVYASYQNYVCDLCESALPSQPLSHTNNGDTILFNVFLATNKVYMLLKN